MIFFIKISNALLFFLKVCYDLNKGAENHNPAIAMTNIFLHLPQVSHLYVLGCITVYGLVQQKKKKKLYMVCLLNCLSILRNTLVKTQKCNFLFSIQEPQVKSKAKSKRSSNSQKVKVVLITRLTTTHQEMGN